VVPALPLPRPSGRSRHLFVSVGDLDASLPKTGMTIPPMDIIIAQVCLHHKVSLFTLDEHFQSIPGLKFFELGS
jgi:predicted nucleic acid-binding protein